MRSKIHKVKGKKTFKQVVEGTADVRLCYRPGKHAIKNEERSKVELTDPRKCGGSLFIDQCLIDQNKYPNDNRWDYAIDYNGKVFFLEVHAAKTDQVSAVLKKLAWLKEWLHHKAPEINLLKAESPFYWVQSKGYRILANSRQSRLVEQEGLKPIPKLILK